MREFAKNETPNKKNRIAGQKTLKTGFYNKKPKQQRKKN
jgi:hypothetical protein